MPIYVLLIISILLGFACTPTYQSSRAYIPQHTEAKQLQVELGTDQADVSYSVTDNIQVNVGGLYSTSESEAKEVVNDVENINVETSTFAGGQVGVGYFTALNEKKTQVFSFNAGSAFQTWDFSREGDDLTVNTGYDNFSASVINPYAQMAFMFGRPTSNISFGLRYERPMFDFEDASGAPIENNSQPSLLNYMFHSKYEITGGLSFFGQFIYRDNLASDDMEDETYEVSSWNVYFGLSYAMGFSAPKEVPNKSETIEVENTDK